MTRTDPAHLAVLISGSGTTLQNLIDVIARGELNAQISVVVASRSGIKGIDRARSADLPVHVVEAKSADFSKLVFQAIEQYSVDLVCLAGWCRLLEIPRCWERRIINIHPSLLPKYGGKGMFGKRVHEAVIAAKEPISGCTVHWVDATYDTGEIILQRQCAVLPTDDASTLAKRVFEEEKRAFPEAIRRVINEMRTNGRC